MGLTRSSIGSKAVNLDFNINKMHPSDKIIALAGNPNVGKSTVFNALTGMNQHTGNWPGKTVSNAHGFCKFREQGFIFVDLPGTYSLIANSREEEVARDFLYFGKPDAVVVVCDATCFERNLNLVLQALEITKNVIVCVNLMDEASKKGIHINSKLAQTLLGVPVICITARTKQGLNLLLDAIYDMLFSEKKTNPINISYLKSLKSAINIIANEIKDSISECNVNKYSVALRLLENDTVFSERLYECFYKFLPEYSTMMELRKNALEILSKEGISEQKLPDIISSATVLTAEGICVEAVTKTDKAYAERDRKIDKFLTNKLIGIPIMILLLGFVFYLTIIGANYPSEFLSGIFSKIQDFLLYTAKSFNIPEFISNPLIFGVYKVTAWVVSVMLPPMAIFFPIFTFFEDLGYLPRVAFNLDKSFKKCSACGKQALTMCMGFGCNAAGVVGCRIIDSPRERLIAVLTNSFVPCNGRFPTLIALISMFLTFSIAKPFRGFCGALILTSVVLLGIFMTFFVSSLLSKTFLKGTPSSFTLELPPYRTPQLGKIIIHSLFDRTLFVLGRAVTAAAPAGLIIWIFANVNIGNTSLLKCCSEFLDPFASLFGLDGVILLAFMLGIPANEIVIPIIIMAYMQSTSISEFESLFELKNLLIDNGWTWITAVCTMLFSLFHWPCATTIMTVKKETNSFKWTVLSIVLPTIAGLIICYVFNTVFCLFC